MQEAGEANCPPGGQFALAGSTEGAAGGGGVGVARTGVGLAKTAVEVGTLGQVRPDWEVTAPPGLDFPEYAAFSEWGTVPLTFIGGAGAERAAVGTLGFLARAVGVTERAAPILERAAQVTGALNRSRAGQWLLRGLEVVRPRGVGVSAVAAEQTERYTPLVIESLEPWRRAVDGWVDPQKYPLANKFLREFPQELALAPGGVLGFKATLLEAVSRGDTKAMGQLAESMARPFYSPVQSFKENPAGTVLMWAMVGGTYAERLRAQVKASNEVERRALEAFADMMAEQRREAQFSGLTVPDRAGREALKSAPVKTVVQRAQAMQRQLAAFGKRLAAQLPGAWWFGEAKSQESIELKVARKQEYGNPEYTHADLNDHIRGTVMVQDWAQAPEVIRKLRAAGFVPDGSVFTSMNDFGFMGAKGERLVGPLGAEVQVWTPEGWELKRWSDDIYEKWRHLGPDPDLTKLPDEVGQAYMADIELSRAKWAAYWDSVDPKVRRAIEDALAGGAQ
jgi:hypothetical protein